MVSHVGNVGIGVYDVTCTGFGGRAHEFCATASRKLDAEWLTDIGGSAGRARLYCAVDEAAVVASVPVASRSGRGE